MKFFLIFIFLVYIISVYIEGNERDRIYMMTRIKKKLSNKVVIFNILVVLLLNIYCYTYQSNNNQLLVALEKSNFAVIISICAYLDIVILPFWIVLYISFFFSKID